MTASANASTRRDETILELRREFDASPAAVFDAWMTREEWGAWIGPEGMRCEVPTLEPTVGGRYEITMRLGNGQVIPVSGVFKVIERPKRLVFSWDGTAIHNARVWSRWNSRRAARAPNCSCARRDWERLPIAMIMAGAGTAR